MSVSRVGCQAVALVVLAVQVFTACSPGRLGTPPSTLASEVVSPSGGSEQLGTSDAGASPPPDPLPPLPEVEPTPPLSPDERQTPLRQGQVAPYAGVLLSPEALARIEVEFRTLRQQFILDLELQRREMAALRLRDVQVLELRVATQTQEHQVLLGGRDREIERLRTALQEAVEDSDPNMFFLVLGALGSAALGTLFGWVLGSLGN